MASLRKKNRGKRRRRDKRAPEETRMMVAVRVRPLLPHEIEAKHMKVCSTIDDKMVILEDPDMESEDILRRNRAHERRYAFDQVFGEERDQQHVYGAINKYLIDAIIGGMNATVFAYGATGAGKTFTMLGTKSQPGIMFLTLQELFRELEKKSEELSTTIQMTYIEIYNETLRDLLVDDSPDLDLREDSHGNPVVCGAHTVDITSPEQVMRLLYAGNTRRTQEATAANATSSRSHAILEIVVRQTARLPGVKRTVQTGRLFMCDLAGSERAAHTKNTGMRMVEGSHINRSLLALGNCINALCGASRVSYVNYRDSKLTRLLKESLSGNCKTVMIAHISPSVLHFEETYNTLNYANRAKNIKTTVVKNTHTVDAHITEYTSIIADLRDQVSALQQQVAELSSVAPDHGKGALDAVRQGREATIVGSLEQAIMENFDMQLQLQQRLFDLQDKELELHLDVTEQQSIITEWLHSTNPATVTLTHGDGAGSSEPAEATLDLALLSPTTPVAVREAADKMGELRRAQDQVARDKAAAIELLQASVSNCDEIEGSLPRRIAGAEHLKLLQKLYDMHALQLANMELTYAGRVNKHVIVAKDTIICRLLQQQQQRDALIEAQRDLLLQHLSSLPPALEHMHAALAAEAAADRTADLQPRSDSYLLSSTGSVRIPFPSRRAVLPPIGTRAAEASNLTGGEGPEGDDADDDGYEDIVGEGAGPSGPVDDDDLDEDDEDADDAAQDSTDSNGPRGEVLARSPTRTHTLTRQASKGQEHDTDSDHDDRGRGLGPQLLARGPTNLSSTFTLPSRRPAMPSATVRTEQRARPSPVAAAAAGVGAARTPPHHPSTLSAAVAVATAMADASGRAGASLDSAGRAGQVSARDSARAVESVHRRLGQPVAIRNARAFASPLPGAAAASGGGGGGGGGGAYPAASMYVAPTTLLSPPMPMRHALKPPPRTKPVVPKSCLTGQPLLDIKVSPYAVHPRRARGPRYL